MTQIPDRLMGRVQSAVTVLGWAPVPLAPLTAGVLLQFTGRVPNHLDLRSSDAGCCGDGHLESSGEAGLGCGDHGLCPRSIEALLLERPLRIVSLAFPWRSNSASARLDLGGLIPAARCGRRTRAIALSIASTGDHVGTQRGRGSAIRAAPEPALLIARLIATETQTTPAQSGLIPPI